MAVFPEKPCEFAIDFIRKMRNHPDIVQIPSSRQVLSIPKLILSRYYRNGKITPNDYIEISTVTSFPDNQELAKDILIHEPKQIEVPVQLRKEAESIIPIRLYKGFIGFDDLSIAQLSYYIQQFGRPPGWISPNWLNQALFLVDGKMSVYQIYQVLSGEGLELELKDLLEYIQFLDNTGKISISSKVMK